MVEILADSFGNEGGAIGYGMCKTFDLSMF